MPGVMLWCGRPGRTYGSEGDPCGPDAHTTQRLWSLRVGDWRVNFALRETEVRILKIGHRRDVDEERAYRKPPEDLSVSEPDRESDTLQGE